MKALLLVTHSTSSTGGAEGEFTRLILLLKKTYKIYLIIPDGPLKDLYIELSDKYVLVPSRVFQIQAYSLKEYLRFFLISIPKFLKIFIFILKNRENIDACYVNSSVCFVELIPVIFFRIKYILSVKESIEPAFIRKFLFGIYSRTAKKIIVISESLKEKIAYKCNPGLVERIYSSIDEKKYVSAKENFVKKSTPGKQPFVIINIGAFYNLKGQHTLLEALKKFKLTDNVKVIFIGKIVDHNYYNRCLAITNELEVKKSVYFLGEKINSETIQEILNSDCIVITSSREGFSLVLLEGFILEKPVVSTPVGVIPEVVQNKENGFIYNTDDHEKLGEIILSLKNSEELYNRIRVNGLRTYFSIFNDEVAVKNIETVIEQVIKNN